MDDEHNKSPINVPVETKETNPVSVAPEDNATAQLKNNSDGVFRDDDENNGGLRSLGSKDEISKDQIDEVSNSIKSMDLAGNISGGKGSFLLFVIF